MLPARPRASGARPAAAVPVVEERGEQRGGRGHAAGLLGQRQRGVLVGQQPGQLTLHRGHRVRHADPAATRTRTGSVLMNGPGTRSAPAPAFIRPNSTVPNTTSSRPATAASTRAQATWNSVAGDTPSRRAAARTRSARSPASSARPRLAGAPSPWTSSSPNGAVGSVTSPSSPAKYRSCSSRGSPSRAWATKSRNGSGSGSRSPSPGQQRPHLAQHHLQPGVVHEQVVDLQQRQPAAGARLGRDGRPQQRRLAQVHPRPGRRQQRSHRRPRPPGPARHLGDRQLRCRQTTWTGSGSPSQATDVR